MAENDNGRLNFSVGIDLDELKRDSEEAVRQFDGIAAEAQAKGADIDRAFGTDAARGASSLSSAVRQSLSEIARSCGEHEAAIASLEGEYSRLGREMSKAYETGRDGDLAELQQRATAVKAEIGVRKELLSQLREQSDALEQEAAKIEDSRRQTDALGESHSSLRQRIRELQEQMAQLREQGIDETSEAYRELTAELGRLRDIQSDIQKQGSVLANDQAQFQGIISGLQGISGGYTAVSGAMSLFGTKNEDLNKIMAKAQSLMSITIGLQQVSQMLDKDSAFQLTTVAKVREWWNKLLDVGRGKTAANTAAVELNTAAHKGNAGAVRTAGAAQQMESTIAETGTAANIGLAGAFRMVGAAIKSIPVFGWIATAITAIVTVTTKFISKAKEARKAADEFNQSVAEMAAEPVSAMMRLQAEWNALGDSMESKQKFIEENRKSFENLGVAIKDVNDAEKVFTSTDTLQAFIQAQLLRAKATQESADIQEKMQKKLEAEQKKNAVPEDRETTGDVQTDYYISRYNEGLAKQREGYQKEIDKYDDEIRTSLNNIIEYNKQAQETINAAGIKTAEVATAPMEGSIAKMEQDLAEAQKRMKEAVVNSEEYLKAEEDVAMIQAQLDAARGKTAGANTDKEAKELENALTKEGKIMAALTKQNEQGRIAQIDDAHEQRMERIKYDYEQEMAEIERQTEELRKANEITGVQTTQAGEGVEDWQVGLTAEQIKEIGEARTLAQNQYDQNIKALNEAEEAEEQRHQAEIDKINANLLNGIETYQQKREKLQQEHDARLESLYVEGTKTLREGVTQGNVDILEAQFKQSMQELADEYGEEYIDEAVAAYLAQLEEGVENMRMAVEAARADLEAAKAEGDPDKIAAAQKKLTSSEKELKTATKNLRSEQKSQQNQQKQGDNDNENTGQSLEKLGSAVSKCGDAFEEMGDAVGGAVGDTLSDIGKVTSSIGNVISSVGQFVEVGIEGMKAAETAGVSAIKSVESACTILAIIDAVLQMVQVIASIFNGDDKKQEEIDALQDRIDQLQWELDNAEAVRIRNATGSAYSVTSELYKQALADAKAANREGQSYVSMLAEWTKAANKATASDVAHEKTVEGLIKTYTNLGYSVDKAIGEDKYRAVGDTVKNYAEQMALVQEQYEKEESKKKSDKSALQDYENEMEELAQSIVDTMNSAMEDIIGGSYEDIAKQLGDAFVDAFEAGEDAAEAWGDAVEDIVNDIVRQMLIQQWIEPKIAEIFDKYMERWFPDGEYAGNDTVVASMDEFSEELNGAMDGFADAWAEIAEAMGWMSENTREAATQGIAAASQESIDELNGRMTAIQGHTFSINDNVAILVTTNNLILQSVVNIEGNTDRLVAALEEAADEAADIHETLDDMQLKGVKVK